jgi:hypothetical protein
MISMSAKRYWPYVFALAWLVAIGCREQQSLDLGTARRILSASGGGALGNIDLAGLELTREIELGEGFRVIAISTTLGGGFALFRGDGSAVTTIRTGKIVWVQLVDLNEDDVSDVLVEEIDGKGTGVMMKSFVLYVVRRNDFKEAWRRPSYRMEAPWNPASASAPTLEIRNLLRFDPSGGGRDARLTYVESLEGGCGFRESLFEVKDGTIQQVGRSAEYRSVVTACK